MSTRERRDWVINGLLDEIGRIVNILAELSESQFWATMVDESTDVTQFQQYLTFVRYVYRGVIKTKFLDTRRLDVQGATGQNLFKYWTDVAADYDLSIEDHVAIGCDGARAMIGANNSLVSRIRSHQPNILAVHCWNHRTALACADSVEELAIIKRFEPAYAVESLALFSQVSLGARNPSGKASPQCYECANA